MNAKERAEIEKSWATRVWERRDELEFCQAFVAQRANITQQSLSRIERGEVTPRFITMDALAQALCTTVEDLSRSRAAPDGSPPREVPSHP